jgi:hypothetical protein
MAQTSATVTAAAPYNLDGHAPEHALLEPAAAAALRCRRAARPADEAARERVDAQREEEREQQRGEDDDHVGVEAGVAAPGAAAQRVLRLGGAPRRRRPRRARVPAHRPGVHAHGHRHRTTRQPNNTVALRLLFLVSSDPGAVTRRRPAQLTLDGEKGGDAAAAATASLRPERFRKFDACD